MRSVVTHRRSHPQTRSQASSSSEAHPHRRSHRWTEKALAATLALIGTGAAAAPDDDVLGRWLSPPCTSSSDQLCDGPGDNWPLVALHAVLTPDGRVLSYGTNNAGANTQSTGLFFYDVWTPPEWPPSESEDLSSGHITLENKTNTDIFCSAQVLLPQGGDVFLAGGDNWDGTAVTNTGNNNTTLFRYTDNSLSRGNNMNRPRWYATTTVLANGEIYIQGGRNGNADAEVRNANGDFRRLSNVKPGKANLNYWYPRNFLAPDGRVFGFDRYGSMYYVTTAGTGSLKKVGWIAAQYAERDSSAAMFLPGKILVGGSSAGAVVIDINGSTPEISVTQSMSSTARKWVNFTILPDGRVLATGGSKGYNRLVGVNKTAAIWDPGTGQWTIGRSGARPRLYHSTALLLPDASVLVAGGGSPGPIVNLHAEIYYPPYLFDSSGEFAARPIITFAPDTLSVGETFSMGVGSATVSRVTLVKTGAVTHSFDMDQRFLELSFTSSEGTLFVETPKNPNDAPPGYYLLFVIDSNGVPSVGKIVRMNIA